MKRTLASLATITLSCMFLTAAPAPDSKPAAKAERIGIYDSRVLAYADFWSEKKEKARNDAAAEAKAAKARDDMARVQEIKAAMKQMQEKNHLQVFSTAPVDDVLATIKDHADAVQKQAGVSRLVSKWDNIALKQNKGAERVDVTDQLLAAFKLNEKQLKVAADIRKKDPLPLIRAKQLLAEGKL